MTPWTESELAELEAKARAATPGPWFTLGMPWCHSKHADLTIVAGNPDPHQGTVIADLDLDMEWTEGEDDPRIQEGKDAAFIAQANPAAILSLIAALRASREANRVMREAVTAVNMDYLACSESDRPKQYFITEWAINKVRQALQKTGDGK